MAAEVWMPGRVSFGATLSAETMPSVSVSSSPSGTADGVDLFAHLDAVDGRDRRRNRRQGLIGGQKAEVAAVFRVGK